MVGRHLLDLTARHFFPLHVLHAHDDLVKAGKCDRQLRVAGMVILRSWLISHFVFDNSKHLAQCEENAASELVLIVRCR